MVVAALDAAGNRSTNSPVATGTPASLLDFAELYDARHDQADGETGGCDTYSTRQQSGSASHATPLGSASTEGSTMMRQIALYSLLAFAMAPLSAHAADAEPSWSIDLQLGSYKPRIDSQFTREAGDVTPYEQAFGDGSSLMIAFAAERQLFRGFSSLSIGLGLAYWNIEGNSVRPDNSSDTDAADTTEMSIYPLNLQATYRFDVLSVRPSIPVIRGGVVIICGGSSMAPETCIFLERQRCSRGERAAITTPLVCTFCSTLSMMRWPPTTMQVYNSYITLEYRYAQVDDFGSSKAFVSVTKPSSLDSRWTCTTQPRRIAFR